jgi:hypothetical protein
MVVVMMVCSRAAPAWTAGSVRHCRSGTRGWSVAVAVEFGEKMSEGGEGKIREGCRCGPRGSRDV